MHRSAHIYIGFLLPFDSQICWKQMEAAKRLFRLHPSHWPLSLFLLSLVEFLQVYQHLCEIQAATLQRNTFWNDIRTCHFLPVKIIGIKSHDTVPVFRFIYFFQLSSGGEEMEVLQQQQGRKPPARGGGARGGRGARGGKKAAGVVTIPDDSDEDDFGSTRLEINTTSPYF